jgi:hypothetical protein
MYAGVLGDITAAAAPTTEADPVGIYVSLLAGTGVFIGPGPYVRVGNTRHPLLLWPLLLGRTGSGRKGEATGTAEIFLRRAAPLSAEQRIVTGLSSGEGLIERIRDDPDDSASDDKRLLVVEPEFTSVMARSKREGSTLAAVQRQAWDGRALSVLNRQQLRASASHIAIIGHITPQEFRLRLADADMTGGTYNRYLPVFVERSQRLPIPEGVDPDTVVTLSSKLDDGIAAAREVRQIQLGRDATRMWTSTLYDEFTEADDEDRAEAEFTRRAAPYCLRVAGLLAALEGRGLIELADLVPAAALIRYSITSARFVLDRQDRNPRLDRIRRSVDAADESGLTRSAVSGLFSRNLTKELLDELLAQLTADGEYEQCRIATGGRPAETYRRVLSSFFVPKEQPGEHEAGQGPPAELAREPAIPGAEPEPEREPARPAAASKPAAYPHAQNWTVQGFRVTVMVYKSHTGACDRCGKRPAPHSVWADGKTEETAGFGGAPANYCDAHRPARGTLPDVVYEHYERSTAEPAGTGELAITAERFTASPEWPCGRCGKASIIRRELRCENCDDPARWREQTNKVSSWDGTEGAETTRHHEPHALCESFSCSDHRDEESA